MDELRTVWRLTGIPDYEGMIGRRKLDLRLTVDTTAEAVVDAIERAARHSAITLIRVETPE